MKMQDNWTTILNPTLPTENETVLIVFINSVGRHIGEATFKESGFYYIAETPTGKFEELYGIVTHWMSLPDLPTI